MPTYRQRLDALRNLTEACMATVNTQQMLCGAKQAEYDAVRQRAEDAGVRYSTARQIAAAVFGLPTVTPERARGGLGLREALARTDDAMRLGFEALREASRAYSPDPTGVFEMMRDTCLTETAKLAETLRSSL